MEIRLHVIEFFSFCRSISFIIINSTRKTKFSYENKSNKTIDQNDEKEYSKLENKRHDNPISITDMKP